MVNYIYGTTCKNCNGTQLSTKYGKINLNLCNCDNDFCKFPSQKYANYSNYNNLEDLYSELSSCNCQTKKNQTKTNILGSLIFGGIGAAVARNNSNSHKDGKTALGVILGIGTYFGLNKLFNF